MQFPKLKNLFVSETCFRFCALDLQISILALAIASKKRSKTISETCAKWSQFGAVSETRGLAITCYMYLEAYLHEKSLKNKKLFSLKEADVVKFFGRFYISPKIKNLKRVGSDARFNTKMQYNAIRYSSKKYALELFVALKYACSC